MKKHYFMVLASAFIFYGATRAQGTSYGGILEPGRTSGNAATTNSYFGHESGLTNTGENNTFIGHRSGHNNTSGYENSGLGSLTLYENIVGARNTANGVYTLYGNTTGNENTAVGHAALGFNTTGNGNTAIGFEALLNNAGNNYGTATGYQALRNSIGNDNTAMGYSALRSSLSPQFNTGSSNTAMGHEAMVSNQSGTGNTALGRDALSSNSAGDNNVGLGREALITNETGSDNVAMGYNAGTTATDLNNTIAIGSSASVGESDAIAIGSGASATGVNSVAIGDGATVSADNEMVLGNLSTTHIRANVMGFSSISDARFKTNVKENVPGLAFITQLRPVSYQLERTQLHQFLTGKATPKSVKNDVSIGFIAQEVEKTVEENGYVFTGVKKPENEKDHYGLRYVEFVVPLIKSVQEQQEIIESQQQLIENLQQEITSLKATVYGTEGVASSAPARALKAETVPVEGFALEQNIPNPFNENTTIVLEIPVTASNAKIVIYNLQGLELQSYPLNERGRTSVEIKGGSLQSGMYLYALLADGQFIDAKRMVLTK